MNLILLILGVCMARALPMTNDQELTALESGEQMPPLAKEQPRPESKFVSRIAPRNYEQSEERPEEQFATLVRQLQAAGVHPPQYRNPHTLTYKELSEILALYQHNKGRHYYDATAEWESSSSAPLKEAINY